MLDELDPVQANLKTIEGQMQQAFAPCAETTYLHSETGVGEMLGVVIWTEIGTIERFGRAEQLASYAGLVPREHSSGGKVRYGRVRKDVNLYLKWAFTEAANSAVLNRERCEYRHVARLYENVKARRGHGKAIIAVARHLAEAAFWMLTKEKTIANRCCPHNAKRGLLMGPLRPAL